MHSIQTVSDQNISGTGLTEAGWSQDEDPEHYTFQGFVEGQGNSEADLLITEPVFTEQWAGLHQEELSEHASSDSTNIFLDSPEFREALEDLEFRADLKKACKWAFSRYSQSTHSSWEDLQQEVLMRFGRWLPRYRNEAKRKTIFARIATNVLIDAHRYETSRRRQHEEIDFDELELELVRGKTGTEIENRIFMNECRKILSDHERAVFDEYFVYGKSLRQLAAKHGVSAAAMSKRWARIMTKLHDR